MEARSSEAGWGLRLMFWGEILLLTSIICMLLWILTPAFPVVGKVLAAVSFLFSLFGLVTAAHAYKGYQSALLFLVASIILWAAINWVESGWSAALLNTACILTNYLMVARVSAATVGLLFPGQKEGRTRQITKVRLRYLMCSAVSAACFLAGSMSWLGALAEIVWNMGVIISLFAGLIYLLFLRDVQNLLRE